MSNGISSLWKSEDWWAVWIGFLIIIGSLLQWIPKIPKVGEWTGSPLDVFLVIKDGVVAGNMFLPLLFFTSGNIPFFTQ